jgi:DNA-directed RNA polymerase subunit RPC12/RpoP
LRRVHRTFIERFSYMAKYRCRDCQAMENVPRGYRLHYGNRCRCPRCGTFRITKLKERDRIDPMETGFLNLFERWMGGNLYHCRYCRVQFFDRRKYIPAAAPSPQPKPVTEETPAHVTEGKSTATPGA